MALIDAELSGLDHLEIPTPTRRGRGARLWAAAWPKLAAAALAIAVWQVVYLSGWRPPFVLPSPETVFRYFFGHLDTLLSAAATTLRRGLVGFGIALVIGTALGAVVSRSRILRSAVGSMITGLQTMPSIAWFPAAILLFRISEGAILFVVVIGAAPSIANGLINGIDNVPPVLLRAGRSLGARGLGAMRDVVIPAALPEYVGGLKQGWSFAWRSLLAGELLVLIAGRPSLGQQLQTARDLADAPFLYSCMLMIFLIGVLVDAVVFGVAERRIRRRYGLVDRAQER